MSVPRESVRAFRKEVVEFAGGRSARKRSYAVFWNVPAFPGEDSFDIFPHINCSFDRTMNCLRKTFYAQREVIVS
jgi:hypothetical protein